MLREARVGAVKARTAAPNTLRSTVITAPESLRTQLRGLSTSQLMAACARLRPDISDFADPTQAAEHALRSIAVRVQHLDTETRALMKIPKTNRSELPRVLAKTSNGSQCHCPWAHRSCYIR